MRFWGRHGLQRGIAALGLLASMSVEGPLPAAEGAPISFQVVDADVRSVLMSAARMGHFNLVLDDSVQGTVTLNLKNVEPVEVLRFVSGARNLALQELGGTFVVTGAARQSGMRGIHSFPVHYGDPEELKNALNLSLGFAGKDDSTSNKEHIDGESADTPEKTEGRGRVLVDRATNTLVLYGTPAEAAAAGELLRRLDVPAKQVSLEAKVIAIQKDASKKLGVDWQWSAAPQYPDARTVYDQHSYSVTDAAGNVVDVRETVPRTETTRHFPGGAVPGIVQFGHGPEGIPYEFYYEARINALVTDGKAEILARPNIMTVQGREAVINIGGSVPVPTVSTTNATTTNSVEYKDAGIILRYTPRVNEDGYITAEVHTEVSSPLYVEEMKAYRFQKRSADTTVRLKDGETMVIGGLIGSEESRSMSKIPFLGDLPILGAFFRSVRHSKSESEIMIFLTAHVMEQ